VEWFFEILFEVVIQLFGEAILDALLRSRHPIANTISNVIIASLFAAILAGITLAVHPQHFIANRGLRVATLITLPIVNGFLMSFVGRQFIRIGRLRSGYEHFLPAFAFSLVFGLIRFAWAR
jgi:hypothetical protein